MMNDVGTWNGVALGLLLSLSGASAGVHAQDDWSLSREAPQSRKPAPAGAISSPPSSRGGADLPERYYRALLREPSDAFALSRLRELSLARDGSLELLIARLQQQSEQRPDDPAALEVLARLWLAEGHLERAELALGHALERFPKRAALHLLRAQMKLAQRDHGAARAAYEAVTLLEPRGQLHAQAAHGLADLALAAGDLKTAQRLFDEVARADRTNPNARTAFARALSTSGRHREAATAYLDVADRLAGDPRAMAPLLREAARAQLAAGDTGAALLTLERARKVSTASEQMELRDLELGIYRKLDRLAELAEGLERRALWAAAGAVWEELGNDPRALTALRTEARRKPRDIDSRERLARVLARAGQLVELRVVYRELVQLVPLEPRYAVALAQLLRDSGEQEEALKLLAGVSARARTSVAVHRALAELYERWGETQRASQELSQLARLEPDEPAHVIVLGEEALARGERRQALAVWQRLPSLPGAFGREGEGQLALAQVLADHDFLEEAMVSSARALELLPTRFEVYRLRASLFERLNRSPEAESAWLKALRLSGADAAEQREARQHLVALWRRQGLTPRKLRELEQQVREKPGDREALWLMAELYAREPRQALREISTLERILQLSSGDPAQALEALRALERAHTRGGETRQVLRVLERLVSADPSAAGTYLARAVQLALESYQDDAALNYATRALALRPNDAKTRKLVGDLYRRRQDLERAVASYELAAELDRQDFDTRMVLAQLETARGNVAAALAWWSSIVAGAPDDAQVARAVRAARELGLDEAQRSAFEYTLIEQVLGHGQRPIYRRLLIETYAQWFAPRLEATSQATPTGLSRRALKPLIEALGDSDGFQRATALRLLSGLAAEEAGPALIAFAEKGELSSERAQALVALGRIADPALVPRLRALLQRCETRLRPFALWALAASEGSHADATLLAALREPDVGLRILSTLELGQRWATSARSALTGVAEDRSAVVRAAAHWALYQLDVAASATALEATRLSLVGQVSEASGPASLAALIALRDDLEVLSRGLLSPVQEIRDTAARLALQGEAALDGPRLPVPRWPFSARDYFAEWVELNSALKTPAPLDESRLERLWPPLTRIAQEGLRGEPPLVVASLSALVPVADGLVPIALLDRVRCFPRPLAEQLAGALAPTLSALASASESEMRTEALLRLTSPAAGPAAAQMVGRVLADSRDPAFQPLVRQLARHARAPSHLRSALLAAFDRSPAWSTRLDLARALGPDVGTERLAKESVGLVRVAASSPQRADNNRCAGASPRIDAAPSAGQH